MDKNNALLTLEEAARYLGVSKTSLRRWTNEGRLDCHRIGARRERRFDIQMLNSFLARDQTDNTLSEEIEKLRIPADYSATGDIENRHICLFFSDQEDQWQNFRSYFMKHYKTGQPTLYIYDSSTEKALLARLVAENINPDFATQYGLLRLTPSSETYLKQGKFTAQNMICFMEKTIKDILDEGFDKLLITGEMTWFFSGAEGVEEIHEYERLLNSLLEKYPGVTIVCQYDVRRFGAHDTLEACCSHPTVRLKNNLQPGFYGAPAAE